MKDEIISIHLGQCGIRLGDKFLEFLTYDHGITPIGTYWESNESQTKKIDVFFEATKKQAHARLFCADLDRTSFNYINSSIYQKLYQTENIKLENENSGTGSNYAIGYYSEKSNHLLDDLSSTMCKTAEITDNLQGFQIIHSNGGGTGSGFGSLLFERLIDSYPKQIISTFTIIPSPWLSKQPLEPYNFILSIPALKKYTHFNICLDNEAVCNILVRQCKRYEPQIRDVNNLMAHAITSITTPLRFDCNMNGTLKRFYTTMIPQRNVHLLLPSLSPIFSTEKIPFLFPNETVLAYEIFRSKNCLAQVDLMFQKILTMATVFRGPMQLKEVNRLMTCAKKQYSMNFSNWLPHNVKCAINLISNKELPKSASCVMNTSAVKEMFSRIEQKFVYYMKRKYMIHKCTENGIDEDEFKLAHNSMIDWMDDYVNFGGNIKMKNIEDICIRNITVKDGLKLKK